MGSYLVVVSSNMPLYCLLIIAQLTGVLFQATLAERFIVVYRYLDKRFAALPAQALHARLDGMRPATLTDDERKKLKDTFHDLALKKHYFCLVVGRRQTLVIDDADIN